MKNLGGFASFWLNFLAFYEYYHKEMMHKEPALITASAATGTLHLWILRYHMILTRAKFALLVSSEFAQM